MSVLGWMVSFGGRGVRGEWGVTVCGGGLDGGKWKGMGIEVEGGGDGGGCW